MCQTMNYYITQNTSYVFFAGLSSLLYQILTKNFLVFTILLVTYV